MFKLSLQSLVCEDTFESGIRRYCRSIELRSSTVPVEIIPIAFLVAFIDAYRMLTK
jgi:hypothetical protein